ncbi:MAG: SEC-C metal-binding domain-containing protein [bacterium]|nr:SEC-C metal-binding domain-containing protein [bacterium]
MGRNAPCPCGSGRKAKKCSATADCLGAWRA